MVFLATLILLLLMADILRGKQVVLLLLTSVLHSRYLVVAVLTLLVLMQGVQEV